MPERQYVYGGDGYVAYMPYGCCDGAYRHWGRTILAAAATTAAIMVMFDGQVTRIAVGVFAAWTVVVASHAYRLETIEMLNEATAVLAGTVQAASARADAVAAQRTPETGPTVVYVPAHVAPARVVPITYETVTGQETSAEVWTTTRTSHCPT